MSKTVEPYFNKIKGFQGFFKNDHRPQIRLYAASQTPIVLFLLFLPQRPFIVGPLLLTFFCRKHLLNQSRGKSLKPFNLKGFKRCDTKRHAPYLWA